MYVCVCGGGGNISVRIGFVMMNSDGVTNSRLGARVKAFGFRQSLEGRDL